MSQFERAIQKAIISWVKKDFPEIIITGTDNENNYKDTGSIGCLGITDLILFHTSGAAYFLELKCAGGGAVKRGKLKQSQIDFNAMFDANFIQSGRFTRSVAYGYLEAKLQIESWLSSIPPAPPCVSHT